MPASEPRFSPLLLAAASVPLVLGVAVYFFWSADSLPDRQRATPGQDVERSRTVSEPPPEWLASWHAPDFDGLETRWASEQEQARLYNLTPWEEGIRDRYRSTRRAVAATAFAGVEPPADREIAAFRQYLVDHYRRMGPDSWRRFGWKLHDEFLAALQTYLADVATSGADAYFHAVHAERPAVGELHAATGDFLLVTRRYNMISPEGELLVPPAVLTLFFLEWWTLQVGEDIPADEFLRPEELRALRLWQLNHAPSAPADVRFQWWRDIEERTGAASDDPEPLVRATVLFQAGDLHYAKRIVRGWLERSPNDPRAREAHQDLQARMQRSAR